MTECHTINTRHRSVRMRRSAGMGLTVMERRSLEASIKKNQKALDLLGQH